jgi:hypothetical protein
MKRIIFITLALLCLTAHTKAITPIEKSIAGNEGDISAYGEDYQNSTVYIWNIDTQVNDKPVLIECNMDIEQDFDILYIFAVDDNGNEYFVTSRSGACYFDSISTELPTGKAKIVLITCRDSIRIGLDTIRIKDEYWGLESYFDIDISYKRITTSVSYAYDPAGNRISRTVVLYNPFRAPRAGIGETEEMEEQAIIPPFVEQLTADMQIKIYPNPTKGLLQVELAGIFDNKAANITVLTLNGQIIMQTQASGQTTNIDLSAQAAGVYLLRLTIGSKVTDYKIIKK